uniref:Autophagy-related protein n=1 Tax=Oryza glumipatula TaxID=40148 RepID=A0A0E0BEC1_9ORYZ
MKPKPFKEEFTLEERAKESASMIASYPARIPIESGLRVIVERFSRSSLPEMEKRKLHLSPGIALFVFVNNTLPQTGN